MTRPQLSDHAPYHINYVGLVPEEDILPVMKTQSAQLLSLLQAIREDRATERHAPYTWSTKEVVGHIIDTERVFGYRALRFARGDRTPLPGFDENAYADAADFDRIALSDLADEFASLRRSHIHFFSGLTADAWSRRGIANDAEISVLAMAYILVGHVRHHQTILSKRFGLDR